MKRTIELHKSLTPIEVLQTRKRFGIHAVLATVLVVFAALSTGWAQVPACAEGKLSDYEKLSRSGCLIGDKQFFDFQYQQGVGGLPSAAISVTPGTTPITDDPGILFEGKWAAMSHDSYVSYTVAAIPNGRRINGASLEMQFGQITGPGKASVTTELCPINEAGQSCGTKKVELQVVLSDDGKRKATDIAKFQQPQTEIRVTTPVEVSPGKGGDVELGGFMTVFQ